jgi:hypothetical protein
MTAMPSNRPGVPEPRLDRPVVGSYGTYAQAQRAIDFLSDNKFAVEHTAIVGTDLKMVETVLGRLTRGRAALAGAGSGAWFGLFVGVLLSLFAEGDTNTSRSSRGAVLYGVVFGAIFGFVAHALSGGKARLHVAQPDRGRALRRPVRRRARRGRAEPAHQARWREG